MLEAQEALDRRLKNNQGRKKQAVKAKAPSVDTKKPESKTAETKRKPTGPATEGDKPTKKDKESVSKDPRECPAGTSAEEWELVKARSIRPCYRFGRGDCEHGAKCHFRHGDQATVGSKLVAAVAVFTSENPAKDVPKPKPKAEVAKPDTAGEDDEGFEVVRVKNVTTFDTTQSDGDKATYVIKRVAQDSSDDSGSEDEIITDRHKRQASSSMTPESKAGQSEWELRLKNKFEPTAEVAKLLRAGAEILPNGSLRTSKNVPQSEWSIQDPDYVRSNPQSYLDPAFSRTMLMDVGPERSAALLDSDLDHDDSISLSEMSDEELAVSAAAEGQPTIAMFFKPIPKLKPVRTHSSDLQHLDQ